MSSEDFQKLMDASAASMEEKFASSMANMEEKFAALQSQLDRLQQDVVTTAANQSSSSHEVMAKLNKCYKFKRKGNKAQFTFNELVDKQIDAAKKQLGHVPTTDKAARQALKKKRLYRA